jgi:hypothetical protein
MPGVRILEEMGYALGIFSLGMAFAAARGMKSYLEVLAMPPGCGASFNAKSPRSFVVVGSIQSNARRATARSSNITKQVIASVRLRRGSA